MTPKSGEYKDEKKKKKKSHDSRVDTVTLPVPSARSLEFGRVFTTQRDLAHRRQQDPTRDDLLSSLVEAAIPAFADWCAIDVVDDTGALRRLLTKHHGCTESSDSPDHDECGDATLFERTSRLDPIVNRARSTGVSETFPPDADDELPWALVVGMTLKNEVFAIASFVVTDGHAGFHPVDVMVAEEVSWSVASELERTTLRRDAREAIRATQRIASQLHQLIVVSITVGSLPNEHDIVKNLATSTRRVFDAQLAVVSLENGIFAPLAGIAHRGALATTIDRTYHEGVVQEFPRARHGATTPWRDGEWLVAPILERRDLTRGVVAARRAGGEFQSEDEEVISLLAQMASSSLSAAELSRSVQHSEARWRILVETAPVGIVEVDAEGTVRWWNLSAAKIMSWPQYSTIANSVPPRFPESAQDELVTLWRDALNDVPSSGRELVEVEINGRRRELSTSAVVLPPVESESRLILTLIDDVTDLRQLKAEVRHAQQMELRGQVASSVAHDFNNLLTLISGYAEILTRDLAGDEKSVEMVRDIQATASRASLLTAQLQAIGRTKSLEPVVLDPVAVLQSMAEVLERIVGHDIELRWQLATNPRHVRVDAGQFEQTILNLAINARDAMPEGGELIIRAGFITLGEEETRTLPLPEGDYAQIAVTDNGMGMDEETRNRCFEPFFTTKGTFKGTGMGLAAARRLVEESGGVIICQSDVGEGTTFEILLPIVNDETEPITETVNVTPPRGSATILLAEDDEGLRQLMHQVLTRNGYSVFTTESGERALEFAREFDGEIDVLVSDVVMSELSGPELAATLQSSNPNLRVLMMSGTADASVLDGLLPGTSTFLAKPFRPSQLIDEVHSLIARR